MDNRENKTNKTPRSIFYYYGIALLVILIFNLILRPLIFSKREETTTYSEFINAVEVGEVEHVYFTETEIKYTKEINGRIYYFKTGIIDNPALPQLLQDKGVEYAAEIPTKPNIFLSILLNYGIPILIFFIIGRIIFLWQSETILCILNRVGGYGC